MLNIEFYRDYILVTAGDDPPVRLETDEELDAFRMAHPEDAKIEFSVFMYPVSQKSVIAAMDSLMEKL